MTESQEEAVSNGWTEQEEAERAAVARGGGNATMAGIIHETAERAVMRRLMYALTGGEDAYWRLVREEVER